MNEIHSVQLEHLIQRIFEDESASFGGASRVMDLCVDQDALGTAQLLCRAPILLAGLEVAQAVFRWVDPRLRIKDEAQNGELLREGAAVLRVEGSLRSILRAEQIAQGLLSRMSLIADNTYHCVESLRSLPVQFLDPKSFSPALRLLEKSALALGGARSRKLFLTDGVLLRAPHISAHGSITALMDRLMESLAPTVKIAVEVSTLPQVHEALDAGADLIIMDHMSLSAMAMAARTTRGRILLEACGHFSLDKLPEIALTGVDFISSTHVLQISPKPCFYLEWL